MRLLTPTQACQGCRQGNANLLDMKYAKCCFCEDVYCSTAQRDKSACVSVSDWPKDWACPLCIRRAEKSPDDFTEAELTIVQSDMNVRGCRQLILS